MRIILIAIAATLIIGSCKNGKKHSSNTDPGTAVLDTSELTTIQWLDSSKDFGKITEGEKLDVTFRFKNTGNKPLVIYMIKPSCGCTLAEEPSKPTAPGETGEIKALFNSKGKPGIQHKSIYVNASTKGTQNHTVYFQVEVVPAADSATEAAPK